MSRLNNVAKFIFVCGCISLLIGSTVGQLACTEDNEKQGEGKASRVLDSEDRLDAFLQPPMCGKNKGHSNRIVGGKPAKLGFFPWMALLGYKCNGTILYLCGGTLISPKHVLTAAHCIHGLEDKIQQVRLGELDLARDDEGATPMDVNVKAVIKHEDFGTVDHSNDIAVLVLEEAVTFTELIRPICLPVDSKLRMNNFNNVNPFVAGWGSTSYKGPAATHLQEAQLPIIGHDICSKAYTNRRIDETVICAGFGVAKDACQGDSGGPLMMPIRNDEFKDFRFYQIGVVSFGRKCAERGYPGVYAKVGYFMPWLEQKIISA